METPQTDTMSTDIFPPRKGSGIPLQIVLNLILATLICFVALKYTAADYRPMVIGSSGIFVANIFFILWSSISTQYKISEKIFYYRSAAFIRGGIDIASIRKVVAKDFKHYPIYFGPALSRHGLLIKYNKYDELYIAPEDREDFVKHLLAINPDIQVVGFDLEN